MYFTEEILGFILLHIGGPTSAKTPTACSEQTHEIYLLSRDTVGPHGVHKKHAVTPRPHLLLQGPNPFQAAERNKGSGAQLLYIAPKKKHTSNSSEKIPRWGMRQQPATSPIVPRQLTVKPFTDTTSNTRHLAEQQKPASTIHA